MGRYKVSIVRVIRIVGRDISFVGWVNNGEGVIGVGPDIEIYAVRFRENLAVIPEYGGIIDLREGMRWCIDNGMQVINMSFSLWSVKWVGDPPTAERDEPLHDNVPGGFYDLVEEATAAGIVMVAAATNDGVSVDPWAPGDAVLP